MFLGGREEKGFFTGINYWGSKEAINMWSKFDEESIENDLRILHEAGITHLRIFPLWSVFQPLTGLYDSCKNVCQYSFGEEPLPDTPAGQAGVSEEACEKLEIFCALAEKYQMKLIVALLTGQMSSRYYMPPVLEGKCAVTDPVAIKWELRYVKCLVNRFKHQKAIVAWDLGNEVNYLADKATVSEDAFHIWCSMIADAVKSCDSVHPVISGIDITKVEKGIPNLKSMGEICDVNTTHPYHIFATPEDPINTMKPVMDVVFKCCISEGIAKIPTFVQEFGSIGYLNCSYKTETEFYRTCLLSCLAHGCHGIMWWCAFDQGHFNYMPYGWNEIGSDYGFFDRNLQPKPLVEENLAFKKLLEMLPEGGLGPRKTDGIILVPRDDGKTDNNTLRSAFMLAERAGLQMNFSYALDPIPDSPLYILPSIGGRRYIIKQRLDELLEKVKKGSVLFLSLNDALLRKAVEITGVNFATREEGEVDIAVNFQGEILPMKTQTSFQIESADAEILARNQENVPVFFKHAYGEGTIFFLTAPLEKYLAGRKGAFHREGEPRYDLLYREAAKAAGICPIVDSDSPFICFTEHNDKDGNTYIFAINYSNKEQTAVLAVENGYHLVTVFGPEITENTLTLGQNSGALYKVKNNF